MMEPELSPCPKCGRDVPTANLVLHEANCGRARSRANGLQTPQQQQQQQNNQPTSTSQHAQQQKEQQSDPEPEQLPEPSAPPLPNEPERGQQTLDRWLSSASTSSSGSSRNTGGASSSTLRNRRAGAASRSSSNNNFNVAATAPPPPRASSVIATNNHSSASTNSSSSFSTHSYNATHDYSNRAVAGINTAQTASGAGPSSSAGTASFAGNIQPPRTTQPAAAQSQAPQAASASATANNQNTQLSEGRWECPRCTLINQANDTRCNACLAPSPNRPPDASRTERLVQENIYNDWVNVTYNPQFRRGRNGIRRIPPPAPPMFNVQLPQNPLVHDSGPVGTAARVFNGLVNGAVVGSVFAGGLGMIVGGLAGAAGGAMVDRNRSREERSEATETRNVANMLASDDGGITPGSVRVHRGSGHITALASDSVGRNRVIRVRYGEGLEARRQRIQQSNNLGTGELRQQVESARDELERSLLEILVQMSYSNDFGPGPGTNVILQPEESFEELIRRFGLGNDNRGASQEVIDSFPVEVVRKEVHDDDDNDDEDDSYYSSSDDSDDENSSQGSERNTEGKRPETDDEGEGEESSQGSIDTDATSELGTCGICLEDYKEGELKKTLSCSHHPHCFHKECIDKWLKLVASCPICKSDVVMYKPPASGD